MQSVVFGLDEITLADVQKIKQMRALLSSLYSIFLHQSPMMKEAQQLLLLSLLVALFLPVQLVS